MADIIKLSDNFSSAEFCHTVAWDSLGCRSQSMLRQLALMLQQVRNMAGRPVVVLSGARSMADYDRLLAHGYLPSPSSDHFCGQQVPTPPGTAAAAKYGGTYALSVGAADIACPGLDTPSLFNRILEMRYKGRDSAGQVFTSGQILLEKHNDWWVHIANDPLPFLSATQLNQRGLWSCGGIGYSLDSGRTFTALTKGKYYGGYAPQQGG